MKAHNYILSVIIFSFLCSDIAFPQNDGNHNGVQFDIRIIATRKENSSVHYLPRTEDIQTTFSSNHLLGFGFAYIYEFKLYKNLNLGFKGGLICTDYGRISAGILLKYRIYDKWYISDDLSFGGSLDNEHEDGNMITSTSSVYSQGWNSFNVEYRFSDEFSYMAGFGFIFPQKSSTDGNKISLEESESHKLFTKHFFLTGIKVYF